MKYLKTFESLNVPQIGDYVACENIWDHDVSEFISNNIGLIIRLGHTKTGAIVYVVEYYNIPEEFEIYFKLERHEMNNGTSDCRDMIIEDIKFWSKNKEDVEEYIATKKYNL